MIEKDEFLEWRRIKFAISAELERHCGHTIGLACCVDSERVGFAFCDAYHGVDKGRREENQRAEYQDEQWKAGEGWRVPPNPTPPDSPLLVCYPLSRGCCEGAAAVKANLRFRISTKFRM